MENSKEYWKFSPIMNIEESNFNRALEKFYNLGIRGLVRENLQNALDAKLIDNSNPVVVTIETGKIDKEHIPGINEIKKRISCLEGHNTYTKETIDHMKKEMNREEIEYISFEDYNTKGLEGAINGQSNNKEDTWGIYAYNKGVHLEEKDEELEKYRGGSHGIGKIASNSASELFVTYFSNCDKDYNKHIGGTVQLIEHKYNNDYYRSTGYFTDVAEISESKTKFYPYENNFHEVFRKDTRGLKIIIPFLRKQFNDEIEIIKSVCDSFFIAILQGRLEVKVNDKNINIHTINDYILNEEYYTQEIPEIKKDFTPLYLNTYLNKEAIPFKINAINREYNFNLYFDYNEMITKGRVAIIRTIGMKIEDKKIVGNVNKPFNAVLIPLTTTEDAFLKSLENESHTELSFEHIKNQDLQKNAKRFINNISKEVSKIIDEEIKKNNPTDGLMDTKDILYIVENQFKQDLENAAETVKLNIGKDKKTIVKLTSNITKKKTKDKDKPKDKKKTLRKINKHPKGSHSDDGKKIKYSTHPDIVNRIIIGDKELLKFDFGDIKELRDINSCDISLAIIDGMGNEYSNEFNMIDNYNNVRDLTSRNKYIIQNNIIEGIEIKNNNVELELELKEDFNKSLKFVYYVEVPNDL